jgi:hypothetical protein
MKKQWLMRCDSPHKTPRKNWNEKRHHPLEDPFLNFHVKVEILLPRELFLLPALELSTRRPVLLLRLRHQLVQRGCLRRLFLHHLNDRYHPH